MSILSRYTRLVLLVLVIVLPLVLVALGGAFIYLRQNTEHLAQHYLKEISEQTGLLCKAENIAVNFSPLPALAFSEAEVSNQNVHFSVAYALVRPDLSELFSGRIVIRQISLLKPQLHLHLNNEPQGKSEELPLLPEGCKLTIVQGQAKIERKDKASLQIDNIQCSLHLAKRGNIFGKIQIGQVQSIFSSGSNLTVKNIEIAGRSNVLSPLTATRGLKCTGEISFAPYLPNLQTELFLQGTEEIWTAETELNGKILWDKTGIPLELNGTLYGYPSDERIKIKGLQIRLDRDRGEFSGIFSPKRTSLDGLLTVQRFSLTQWFGFARNLPPGLQKTLDNIHDAELGFHLDLQQLNVFHVTGVCADAYFSGRGGVQNWHKPVVTLHLASDKVNLGKGIPEAIFVLPAPPLFQHAPLLPLSNKPWKHGDLEIGYDILLRAKQLDYGHLRFDNAQVRITPEKLDKKTGFRDVVLQAEGQLYGGEISGLCQIGGNTELTWSITANAQNVNGNGLLSVLKDSALRGGVWNASAQIKTQGATPESFLSKIRGNLSVKTSQGQFFLSGKNQKMDFASLDLNLNLRSGTWKNKQAGLDGIWSAKLVSKELKGNAELNGRVWFGGKDFINLQKVPSKISLIWATSKDLKRNINVQGSGQIDFQSTNGRLAISNAKLSAFGINVTGMAETKNEKGKLLVQGAGQVYSADLKNTLRLATGTVWNLPTNLNKASLAAKFRWDNANLSLSEILAKVSKSSIKGTCAISNGDKKHFDLHLTVDVCDLDPYLANLPRNKNPNIKWNFKALRDLSIKGSIAVGKLIFKKLQIQDITFPFTLKNGELSCQGAKGKVYGGELRSKGLVDFGETLYLTGTLNIKDANLAPFSADLMQDSRLGGKASILSRVSANLSTPAQWPNKLNGSWSCKISDALYQKLKSSGKPEGTPTRFDKMEASGTVTSGVVRSKNIKMQSSELNVNGGGWVDLDKKTLDCEFNINMKNLPEFPLRLYGHLDKSKRSIGAGQMFINVFSGLGRGLGDMLNTMLNTITVFFRR